MKPLFSYLSASRHELGKVTWPNRRQTVKLTLAVIVFSFSFAALLGTLDYVFASLLQKLILKG
ncbi:MAG: preprotein translocase subunit SecE [Candidatus Saccharibacteria bacterium]